MVTRRIVILGAAALALIPAAIPAAMAEPQDYSEQAFAAAQAAGKPILLDVHAPWCPTCKAQEPILSKLSAQPKFKDFVVMRIDFDSKKNLLRKFKVRYQSTLIVFKGAKEVGRSTGNTDPASIEALLDKAV